MTHTKEELLKEFVEDGAELEHSRWSKWQSYFFGKCDIETDDKNAYMTLPIEFYQRWLRQIETPYGGLSELEKESDRREVRSYLPLLTKVYDSAVEGERERLKIVIGRMLVEHVDPSDPTKWGEDYTNQERWRTEEHNAVVKNVINALHIST